MTNMTKDTYPKCYAKFKKSSLEIMNDLLKKTTELDREHGANLCMDKNKMVNVRNICIGSKCSVDIDKLGVIPCKREEIKLGHFHTHTRINTPPPFDTIIDIPSPSDWYLWLGIGEFINVTESFLSCIGAKDSIKCYQKRRDHTLEEGNAMVKIATNMEESGGQVNKEYPDPQDPALKRYKKYNKELEKYYYKFDPEECRE